MLYAQNYLTGFKNLNLEWDMHINILDHNNRLAISKKIV